MTTGEYTIQTLRDIGEREIAGLSRVLAACVRAGASVSFMWPFDEAKAAAFWLQVAPGVRAGKRILLVALNPTGEIIGTVQVLLDFPENQPHRGEIAKMLVHPDAQRQGIGGALLAAAEAAAGAAGKTLLVLDTVTGASGERLYARHGWRRCGDIPGYALFPDGRPCATTVFYKALG